MLIVPYTFGSASPVQIAEACQGRVDFAFLVHEDDEPVSHAVPMLRELGEVLTHSGDPSRLPETLAPLKPSGVVVFADSKIQLAAEIAEAFGLPHNSRETCALLRSKLRQRQCLNAHNVGRVQTFEFFLDDPEAASIPAEVRFPAVVKPAEGASSKDSVVVRSRDDLASLLSALTPGRMYVVEEYIRDADMYGADWLANYISVESAVSRGAIGHIGISARLPLAEPVREGGLIFSVPPDEETAAAVVDLAERAIRATGVTTGLVHTEIKMSPDGPQVIEVNARLGGWLERVIPRAAGLDPVRLAVDLALGDPLPDDFGVQRKVVMVAFAQPPMAATAVDKMPSASELRALPGVFGVDRRSRNGQSVDWRNGTLGRLYDIWIEADSVEELGVLHRAVVDVLDRGTSWVFG